MARSFLPEATGVIFSLEIRKEDRKLRTLARVLGPHKV